MRSKARGLPQKGLARFIDRLGIDPVDCDLDKKTTDADQALQLPGGPTRE